MRLEPLPDTLRASKVTEVTGDGGSVRSTTRVRAPSVSELPGQLTTSVEREVDVPGGAERAQERSRAVRRRCQGAPARLVDRTGVRSGSARPLESVHYGTQGGGFRVQHSLNVPALVGTASSDVRIFPAQRAPRSGPRRASRREHPPPCDFSLSALIPKGLLHQARLSLFC